MNKDIKILLGLTTTAGSDWRAKIEEIKELGLSEIALFPTCLEAPERKELYKALENTQISSVPLVHLRHDMETWELDYFHNTYTTQLFNIHASDQAIRLLMNNPPYQKSIYLENTYEINEVMTSNLKFSAGLCLDFAHWYDYWFLQKHPDYEVLGQLAKDYPIGCCHISVIKAKPFFTTWDGERALTHNSHDFQDFSEFDYLKNFTSLLPSVCAIELQNSLKEQLKVKEHLEKMFDIKDQ